MFQAGDYLRLETVFKDLETGQPIDLTDCEVWVLYRLLGKPHAYLEASVIEAVGGAARAVFSEGVPGPGVLEYRWCFKRRDGKSYEDYQPQFERIQRRTQHAQAPQQRPALPGFKKQGPKDSQGQEGPG